MVDRDQRHAGDRGDRLARHQADHDAADQPGPRRGGDRVERVETQAGLVERLGDQPVDMLDMRAGGDLGHDAAVMGVLVGLAAHAVGQHAAIGANDRGAGLIATGLDAEHDHRCVVVREFAARRPFGRASVGPAVGLGALVALVAQRVARAPARVARLGRHAFARHVDGPRQVIHGCDLLGRDEPLSLSRRKR